jgi:hypothetical protein
MMDSHCGASLGKAEREPEIPGVCGQLEHEVDKLEKSVHMLEERIVPVLTPPLPSPACEPGNETACSTSVGTRINIVSCKVQAIVSYIHAIRERVEV